MNTLQKLYNTKLKFDADTMSDYEASFQLNHTKVDQSTLICTVDGIDLYLLGCTTISTPRGHFISGDQIIGVIYTDVKATKKELLSFLQGAEISAFEGYEVTGNPWFEWQERDGETVGEVFDEIPVDINELNPHK